MNEKVKELIETYEAIINGDDEYIGLFDCYDNYYKGVWDEKIEKVKRFRKELNL